MTEVVLRKPEDLKGVVHPLSEVESAFVSLMSGGVSSKLGTNLTDEQLTLLAQRIQSSSLLKPLVDLLQRDLVHENKILKQQLRKNRSVSEPKDKVKKDSREEKLLNEHKLAMDQLRAKHLQNVRKLEDTIKLLRDRQKASCVKLKVMTAAMKKSRPRCTVEGCFNIARGKSRKCIGHGGGPRCTFPGCSSGALSANLGLCGKHAIANAKEIIVCHRCSKEFRSLEGLRSHMKNKVCEKVEEADVSQYKHACEICSRKFKSIQGLSYHKKIAHEHGSDKSKRKAVVFEPTTLLASIKRARSENTQSNSQGAPNALLATLTKA